LNAPGSARGAAVLAVALLASLAATVRASAPTSLTLQAPADVKVWSVYDASERRFVNWITWRDAPDSCAAFIHQPDTTGWLVESSAGEASLPTARGAYNGDIDRTVVFRAIDGGAVGVDSVVINYDVRDVGGRQEYLSGRIILLPSYVPNAWLPLILRNQRTLASVDFGVQIRFSAGRVDTQGGFILGLEDFEGFHIWRGTRSDGKDLEVIGEVSKEEASRGRRVGGSLPDSVYFYDIIPDLRQDQPWFSPFGNIDCLGTRIDLPLDDDQVFWFDCDASNGFTYYYAVTSFDRGYTPSSSQQGLTKVDHCPVTQGVAYPCELETLKMESTPQDDLYKVYAVPNPFRSGTSRLTADNYHNFPDDFIRFVNVPADCTIRIYTVSGDLVWWHTHEGGSGNVEWDTRNGYEEPVASGVYVFRLEASSGDSVYGRITIIR
jgi:hypothetical protein